MRVNSQIVLTPVSALRESARNRALHADLEPAGRDSWLVDDIRAHGILLPLLVEPNGALADGHRRLGIAKLLGITHVPCLVLQAADDAAFRSAQLARSMTLYAKCALYRDRINELLRRGHEISISQLRVGQATAEADSETLDRDWAQCVGVLNVSRRSLSRGVRLLDSIDELRVGADPAETDRAARILNVFRNRGLQPALRMIGEADDNSLDESEPDCGAWRGEGDDKPGKSKMRGPKKKARKHARKSASELQEAWLDAALDHLRRFEKLAARHGALTPRMGEALNQLRQGVECQPLRVA